MATRADPAEAADFLARFPETVRIHVLVPDTHGVFRGKWMPPDHLPALYEEGLSIAKSIYSLDIWGRDVFTTGLYEEIGDPDGVLLPIPGTLVPVPWSTQPAAQVTARLVEEDGTPFFGDPRTRLEAAASRIAERGLTPVAATELEFMLLKERNGVFEAVGDVSGPERQAIYGVDDLDMLETFISDVEAAARAQNVPADTVISEAAAGQFEVNLKHGPDIARVADEALLLKRIIIGIAARHGMRATFMPKPFHDRNGSGMHVHMSLVDAAGFNAFSGAEGEALLSKAIAGLLTTMPEATALFVPGVNGYRRMSATYAADRALWAENNRYTAIRLPRAKAAARRFEHRAAGADANPFLVLAAILGGVDDGIRNGLQPPPPVTGHIRHADGAPLPGSLAGALAALESSAWAKQVFGADYLTFFRRVKAQEADVFARHVSALERETYL